MIKKSVILLLSIFCANVILAQSKEKGLATITEKAAKAHINFLAHDELEGREAGLRGSRIAREYIISRLTELEISPLNAEDYTQQFSAYARERQNQASRFQVNEDSAKIYQQEKYYRKLDLNNILAFIEGKNKDEYVIVGAHYDHIGMDNSLVADKIYNGADDNASGVSAVLQIAKAFVESGKKPNRNIIFAFWDGEEKGLLGSEYFVQSCSFVDNIKGYLNFDMIGRNNKENDPSQFVFFYTEAYPIFEDWLSRDIKKYNLKLNPEYIAWDKPIGGSDNTPFAKKDIPIIWYHTNDHPDYHGPGDESHKINWEKLVEITKASYLNMWDLANNFE